MDDLPCRDGGLRLSTTPLAFFLTFLRNPLMSNDLSEADICAPFSKRGRQGAHVVCVYFKSARRPQPQATERRRPTGTYHIALCGHRIQYRRVAVLQRSSVQ